MSDVIEGDAVEVGTEVTYTQAPPPTLFRTDDPVEVLKRAKATAEALAPVIREAGLVSKIEGKEYLNVEAWQTLGQQVGVTGVITTTRKLDNGWEARCEARTLDGRTIGAADSMCLRDEVVGGKKRWAEANDFEIRSMAQTRAMSRALASVLRFIPTLAGMGGTPAEEMGNVKRGGGGARKPSEKQLDFLNTLIGKTYEAADADRIRGMVPSLSGAEVSKAIGGLKDKDAEVISDLANAAVEWASKQSDTPPPDTEGLDPVVDDEGIPF